MSDSNLTLMTWMLPLPNHRVDANAWTFRPTIHPTGSLWFTQRNKTQLWWEPEKKTKTQIHVNVHKSCRLDRVNLMNSCETMLALLYNWINIFWAGFTESDYIEKQCVVASVHPVLTEHGLPSWQAPLDLMRSDRWSLWLALTGLFCTKYRQWILFPISHSPSARRGQSEWLNKWFHVGTFTCK